MTVFLFSSSFASASELTYKSMNPRSLKAQKKLTFTATENVGVFTLSESGKIDITMKFYLGEIVSKYQVEKTISEKLISENPLRFKQSPHEDRYDKSVNNKMVELTFGFKYGIIVAMGLSVVSEAGTPALRVMDFMSVERKSYKALNALILGEDQRVSEAVFDKVVETLSEYKL